MSYVVLARKYRPNTFAEVVGQEHVTRTLANAFAKGRVHHAFLFCGPRGVGKTTAARILGKALNCEAGPTAEPCGTCSACETIASGTAVDYYEMDGASNRGIDAIRDLTEAVRYQPAVLRKKVYVIDEVHMLTTEAFNALLKTLEEPPPHVSFVLATTEPHKVLNTILSRCQRYDFKLVPAPKLSEHLRNIFTRESITIDDGAVSLLVRESGGSVRDALSLCDQVISYVGTDQIRETDVAEVLGVADRALTRSLVGALAEGDAGAALEAVEAALGRGVDEVQITRAIMRYLRDLAVVVAAPDADALLDASVEERQDLRAMAESVDRSRVAQMFDRMVRASNDLGQTQQPRLVLELALIEVAAIEPIIPLGDLVDRLAELERRLAGGGGGGGGGPGGATGRGRGPRSGARARAPSRPASALPDEPPPGAEAGAATPESSPSPAPPARVVDQASPPPPTDEPVAIASDRSPPRPVVAPRVDDVEAVAGPGAAPAPEPTPAVVPPEPATADAMVAEWERLLPALGETHRSLAGFFEHAQILSWRRDRIEIGFAPELSPVAELASEHDNLTTLRAFLREHYGGHGIDIAIRVLAASEVKTSGPARSVVDRNRARASEERRLREREARMHPIYKKVVATFGTPINEEIRTDV
ncbi:DNA polymerase III subunit gamma/tau [Haliangium sp.]|uniref:DNA polymerase III subunit gamma/tau n=1 Tax=Haliangium sp. TaxID=2663208 RepID=UPI003D0D424A